MAKHVIVGCAGLPHGVGWPRYFQRLPYLETSALLNGPVRPSVLRRWKEGARHGGAFGVVAPAIVTHAPGPRGYGPGGWTVPAERAHEAGSFRPTELVKQGVATLVDALTTLDAGVAVFRTPPEFSPSQSNRDALRRFFSEEATIDRMGGRARVWMPSGLWDPLTAHTLAGQLGILCGLDPLGADPENRFASMWAEMSGDDAYLVVSGLGRGRRRTSNDHLEQIAEIALRHDRTWVVFATVDPFPDAIRFAKLASPHALPLRGSDAQPGGPDGGDADDDPDGDPDDADLSE